MKVYDFCFFQSASSQVKVGSMSWIIPAISDYMFTNVTPLEKRISSYACQVSKSNPQFIVFSGLNTDEDEAMFENFTCDMLLITSEWTGIQFDI